VKDINDLLGCQIKPKNDAMIIVQGGGKESREQGAGNKVTR
jgi:hypothetical protein